MALTATFLSDFSRFYADVAKATSMLGGFQNEADNVGKSLDKVPDSFNDINKATKTATDATIDWKSALTATASFVGVAFSVNAVKNFALGVIDTAARIGDLSEKLGISAEAVQRFTYAADQSGSSITTVQQAIKAMNVNLAEGSKSTIAALAEAGLKFEDIRRMSPERAFEAIGDAVAGIEDPMTRAKVATELFGKAGQELVPTFLAGIRDVGKQTAVMSDDTVARLKAAQDAWGRFSNAVTVYSGEAIGWVAKLGSAWQRASEQAAAAANPFKAIPNAIKDFDLSANAAVQSASDLGAMIATIPEPAKATAAALKPVALTTKEAAEAIEIMNLTLDKVPQKTAAVVDAERRLERSRADLAAMSKAAAGSEFEWQNQILLTKFKVDQLTVSETRLYEATGTLAAFVASHPDAIFPYPPQGTLDAWKAGQQTIVEMAPQVFTLSNSVAFMNTHLGAVEGILGGIQTGWAQTATVGARAIQSITSNLMSGNWVGAIVAATAALGGFIAKLFGASEESKKVSPMRDEFFRLQGGLETLNPKVQALEGNLSAVQAVFDAKTVQQYDAAIANLNRILAQDTSSLDQATNSAAQLDRQLREIPTKIPIEIAYHESNRPSGGGGGVDVPGYATGTGGVVDFGAGTLAMLHGREAVVPESVLKNGGGLGAAAPIGGTTVVINAQGAFFDTPGDLQRLADKVNDALTAKYGLTNRNRAA